MNPVAVEQEFQALIATVPLLMSRRTRLLKVCEFLEPLIEKGQKQFVLAYSPESLQTIQKDLPHCTAEGTRDQFYARLGRLLNCLKNETNQLLDGLTWDQLIAKCAVLQEQARNFALRGQKPPLLETHWKHRGRTVAPLVPVVETEPLVPGLSGNFASICLLRIEAGRKQRKEKDDSVFLELYADPEGAQKKTILAASKAARLLFEKLRGKRFQGALNIHCSFGQQGTIIGNSSGLAAAGAIYCELVRLSEESVQVSFLPGIALTGTVDEAGNVRAVDVDGLEKKLEACLYSRTKCVVVPKEQLAVAESILGLGKESDGVCPPDLIGVTNLEEVFYDRRITHFHTRSLPARLGGRLWRQRRLLVGTLIAVLLAVIAVLAIPRLDNNPVYGEFKDKWLIVKNRYGHELEREEVGARMVSWASLSEGRPGHALRLCSFYDVDGDGISEIFYLWRDEREGVSDKLICRSFSGRGLLWEKPLAASLSFPKKADPTGKNFRVLGFYLLSLEGVEGKKVFLFGNDIFFPSIITRLDARSGSEEQTYLHVGQLGDVVPVDLDGDGSPELVGSATNNAYQSAAVFALDPRDIGGCSPATGDYIPEKYIPAHHKEYVLIPRTSPGEVIKKLYRRNGALTVEPDTSLKRLAVNVDDFGCEIEIGEVAARTKAILHGDIIVQFDYRLRPMDVGTTNNYDLAVEELVRLGWMKEPPGPDYFVQYRKTFPRWNGRAFVPAPKSYR